MLRSKFKAFDLNIIKVSNSIGVYSFKTFMQFYVFAIKVERRAAFVSIYIKLSYSRNERPILCYYYLVKMNAIVLLLCSKYFILNQWGTLDEVSLLFMDV